MIPQFFGLEIISKARQPLRLPLLFGYCQVFLSYNLNAGFFDDYFPWKISINILNVLHGDSHQRKVASQTTTFGWLWPCVKMQDSLTINIFGRNLLTSQIMQMEMVIKKSQSVRLSLCLGMVASCSIKLQGYLIINKSGRNQ